MQGTVLKNQRAAINTHDFSVGECVAECVERLGVFQGLVVGGHQNGTIDDEEIGMSGRKSLAVFVIARIG